jgi:hypothetical protein
MLGAFACAIVHRHPAEQLVHQPLLVETIGE